MACGRLAGERGGKVRHVAESLLMRITARAFCTFACCCAVAAGSEEVFGDWPSVPTQPWMSSPYRCTVWLVWTNGSAAITAAEREIIGKDVAAKVSARFHPIGTIRVRHVRWPRINRYAFRARDDIERLHREQRRLIEGRIALHEGEDHGDKQFAVTIRYVDRGLTIVCSEFDSKMHGWSESSMIDVAVAEQLATAVVLGCQATFTPIARIESITEEKVEMIVRGSRLLTNADQVGSLPDGSILVPLVVRKDRNGRPRTDAAREVPWTVIVVAGQGGPITRGRIVSGYGQPLRTRRTRRLEQFAQLIRAPHTTTTLSLRERETGAQLASYELWRRDESGEPSLLVAKSNDQGNITLDKADVPFGSFLVRHGSRFLIEVPLVVGRRPVEILNLRDDDERLEIEGFVRGVQDQLVDLVTQRQIIAQQIRLQIERKEWEAAEQSIQRLRQLGNRTEFVSQVQSRQRQLAGGNLRLQQRYIDRMFQQTRELLDRHLDPLLPQRLTEELNMARNR